MSQPHTNGHMSVISNPSHGSLPVIHPNNTPTAQNVEQEFDNPTYELSDVSGSSDRPQSNTSELYSFVGENGSYFEYLQEGELAI